MRYIDLQGTAPANLFLASYHALARMSQYAEYVTAQKIATAPYATYGVVPPLYTSLLNLANQDALNSAYSLSSVQSAPINNTYARSTIRGLLTAAGAVQKVFKARLDDTKSFLTLPDLATHEIKAPLVESGAYYSLRAFTKQTTPQTFYQTYRTCLDTPSPSTILERINTYRPQPFLFFNATQSDAARYI